MRSQRGTRFEENKETLPTGDLDNILVVDGVPVIDKEELEKLLQEISKVSLQEKLEGEVVDMTYRMFLDFGGENPRRTTDSYVVVKASCLLFSRSVNIARWRTRTAREWSAR